MKLEKKIFLEGTLEVLSGLHIGGTDVGIVIGGVDNPVVKDPVSGLPYIPGSSLKGKIRSLLEKYTGNYSKEGKARGNPCDCGSCDICELFGSSAKASENNDKKILGRLIVRDAFLDESSNISVIDLTEIKTEVTINRLTSKANPRKMERVVKGTKFNVEFIIDIYENDSEEKYINLLQKGIKLLEDDYLGGSGTRGYGKVKIDINKIYYKDAGVYDKGEEPKPYTEGKS